MIELEITEPGLIYGATVFTTMRVYNQSLQHPLTNWRLHKKRLKSSLQAFGWQQPNWKNIQRGIEALINQYPLIRIVIFADGKEWITGRYLANDLKERQQQGITAWLATDKLYQRPLAHYKTGNYLGAYLALQQAQKLAAQEAILIDALGNWLETSTGNLWGYRNECWYTPPLSGGILPGISRSYLLTCLKKDGITVKEEIWTSNLVKKLEVIAYSNCGVEIIPFQRVINADDIELSEAVMISKIEQLSRYYQL